jgi:hypothetical protein
MTRTFLVAVELDPAEDPETLAQVIQEELSMSDIPVTSVKPWSTGTTDTQNILADMIPPTDFLATGP